MYSSPAIVSTIRHLKLTVAIKLLVTEGSHDLNLVGWNHTLIILPYIDC